MLIEIEIKSVTAVIPAKIMFWLMLPLAWKILLFNAVGISDSPTQVMMVPPTSAGTKVWIIL